MLTATAWQKLTYYRPEDFKHPEKMKASIVWALDRLSVVTGRKAVILSDWRLFDKTRSGSQHPLGQAVDVYFPEVDPLVMLNKIKTSRLFSGIGVYRNEKGVVSFHLDTRPGRSPANPALWGAFIRPGVESMGKAARQYSYTTMSKVVEVIDAFRSSPTLLLMLSLALLYSFYSRRP